MQSRKAYPSDVTDEQWKIIGPLIPKPKAGGAPAKFARREVLNGILYVLRTGCAWRELPHDLPPWDTVYGYFRRWTQEGLWEFTAASVQDRDGAKPLLRRAALAFGRLSKVWADSGYAGKFVAWVKQLRPHGKLHLEVVRSPKPAKGFAVQPRRRVIEPSFAWLTKCRRLVKDYERLLTHSAAFIHLAFTGLMLRSLSR